MNKEARKENKLYDNGNSTGDKTGILEWFHFEDHDHVERSLDRLREAGITHLRTGFSWADFHRPKGRAWFDWLIPKLTAQLTVLPCFHYTPASLGLAPRINSPLKNPKDYADFLDLVIRRYDDHFEYVELWNEPNNTSEYDFTLDPSWSRFTEMINQAAHWARQLGKKTVLGGMSPFDPGWLMMMRDQDALEFIDVIGIHGFPDVFDPHWKGWKENLETAREVLAELDRPPEVWVTEAGFSTWQTDERRQVKEFIEVMRSPAERVYWYGLFDLDDRYATIDGHLLDTREYHFGMIDSQDRPKLLFQLLQEEQNGRLRPDDEWMARPYATPVKRRGKKSQNVLITGGAGFVGVNLADSFLREGHAVTVLDNLSRKGVKTNLRWLKEQHGRNLSIEIGDIRNRRLVRQLVGQTDAILHLAGQVAVTTSFDAPREDFEINVEGTFNLLNAARKREVPPAFLFTSTNKVYGNLNDLSLREGRKRYEPASDPQCTKGISEQTHLDFHSPYGCSKGAADQYVLDFARSFNLPAVVFRMSCIYGPHQCGNEDQGWVAHFLLQALRDEPITIFGDGKQVRDILYIEDLAEAFRLAWRNADRLAGQAFNIGGGIDNSVSLLELIGFIEEHVGREVRLRFDDWRPGDQRFYVSDIGKFQQATGWSPKVSCEKGIGRLIDWFTRHRRMPESALIAGSTLTRDRV